MKKILVTGGAGYIGSHAVIELLNQGYKVVVADNLSTSRKFVIERLKQITGKDFEFEKIDLCNKSKIAALFNKHKDISGVMHFAALKAVGESMADPLLYYRNNIISLLNVLEKMQEYEIKNIIFSSSCTVYGEPEKLPVGEREPIKPSKNPYGRTKQIGESIMEDVSVADPDINAVSLRYFNAVGAHKSGLIGELPLKKPQNLMPNITQVAAGIQDEIVVFGSNYNTPDGSAIRDYIHVVDLVDAHVKALKRLERGKNKKAFEYFNLGAGRGYSVLEVIKAFEKYNKLKINYRIAAKRPGDIAQIYANPRKAKKELGWKPKRGLKEMVVSAWRWEKRYRNQAK